MPDARCTHGPGAEGNKHTVVTTGSPKSPAIPCAMVLTVSFALSPVIGLLPPSSLRSLLLRNLTPASRRQDHTTSPSAIKVLSSAARLASTASRPAFRDDREPPL